MEEMMSQLLAKVVAGEGSASVIALVIITNILSFLGARRTSKDTKDSDILDKTMLRQKELDDQQKEMVSQFRTELERMREEIRTTREENNERRADNERLYEKNQELMSDIHNEKLHGLKQERDIESLQQIINDREEELFKVQLQNTELARIIDERSR